MLTNPSKAAYNGFIRRLTMAKYSISYLEQVKGDANQENFFIRSQANWLSCQLPAGDPAFVSNSGSSYWYTEDGVIRTSDHWGTVATCRWTLDGGDAFFDAPVAAFCRWEDISLTVGREMVVDFPDGVKVKPIMKYQDRTVAVDYKVA
jgi:hypothetical protein